MLWKTHMTGGIVFGALLAPQLTTGDITAQTVFIACAGVGGLLPDIDSIHSKLGRVFMPVSATIQLIFGHRGIFHTLLLPALLFGIMTIFLPIYGVYYIPLLVGYISHILLDMLTPEGVPLLWPVPTRFSIPLVQTGGIIERFVFIGLSVSSVLMLIRIGGGI